MRSVEKKLHKSQKLMILLLILSVLLTASYFTLAHIIKNRTPRWHGYFARGGGKYAGGH